jgi:ketosteroid isomerase-like protein
MIIMIFVGLQAAKLLNGGRMEQHEAADAVALLATRVEELEAREAIRDTIYRYCRGADRCDTDLIKSAYHPDAFDAHGGSFSGNAHEFAEFITGAMADAVCNHHYVTNVLIELHGDRAFVESGFCYSGRIRLTDGKMADIRGEGRYLDVFEQRASEWKIAHRLVLPEKTLMSEVDGDGVLTQVPAILRPVRAGREDLVYRSLSITDIRPEIPRTDPIGQFGATRP